MCLKDLNILVDHLEVFQQVCILRNFEVNSFLCSEVLQTQRNLVRFLPKMDKQCLVLRKAVHKLVWVVLLVDFLLEAAKCNFGLIGARLF